MKKLYAAGRMYVVANDSLEALDMLREEGCPSLPFFLIPLGDKITLMAGSDDELDTRTAAEWASVLPCGIVPEV